MKRVGVVQILEVCAAYRNGWQREGKYLDQNNKIISPPAWRHIHLNGHYTFGSIGQLLDLD